jgi:hypothetical protein
MNFRSESAFKQTNDERIWWILKIMLALGRGVNINKTVGE